MAQGDVGIYASQISGHLWAPNGAYDALATVTVPSGGVASVSFAGIPAGYKHLQLRITARNTGSGAFDSSGMIRFNSDTGSNYTNHEMYGTGSGSVSSDVPSGANPWNRVNWISGASQMSANIIDILDYANTSKYKTVRNLTGSDTNGSGVVVFQSASWLSTNAISSIELKFDSASIFAQYSSFALYGVK